MNRQTEIFKIENLSIGMPKTIDYGYGNEMKTGIYKDMVAEAFLTIDGFRGDGVADLRFHGGLDRAVCVYPFEHYAGWEAEFQTPLPRATFGENLTVKNMLEKDVHIGDVFQVGDAIIQITQSRIPCSTITKRTNLPFLLTRMVETGYTGYLCRVLKEGIVLMDSEITLVEQHPAQISVLTANDIYFQRIKDRTKIESLLNVEALAESWRNSLAKRFK